MAGKVTLALLAGCFAIGVGIGVAEIKLEAPASIAQEKLQATAETTVNVVNCAKPVEGLTEFKTYKCPIGGEEFQILTFIDDQYYDKTVDLRPISRLSYPAPLPMCPSNGFFIDKDEYTDAELEDRRSVINSDSYKELLSQGYPTHVVGLDYMMRLKDAVPGEDYSSWYMALQASWEADHCGSEHFSDIAVWASNEIQAALPALQSEDPNTYYSLIAAVPDLYRLAGQFEPAIWLAESVCKCKTVPAVQVLLDRVAQAAREQNRAVIEVRPTEDPDLVAYFNRKAKQNTQIP